MVKVTAYLLLGIGVGLGVAYWQGIGRSPEAPATSLASDGGAPVEQRLNALETSLARERYERERLADELASLKSELGAAPAQPSDTSDPAARIDPRAARVREAFPDGFPETQAEREQYLKQRESARLVDAGFSADRAQWILEREDELQMKALEARYEATQNGASPEEVARLNTSQLLRSELGDADYEKYLQAQGRPTTVAIRDVLTNSPAETAGLLPGDEIVAYNGRRVFDINELSALTNEAAPGSTASLDVLREGQRMQVYVRGGPIGISGGGRSVSRRELEGGGRGGPAAVP